VVFPGAFATLKMKKAWGEDCPEIIAETNNLPYDTRLTGPAKAALFGRNVVNIAFMPADKGAGAIERMREDLFPFEHVYADVLECGLSVLNPAIHTGPCLLNVSNIENPAFDFYVYEHGITPSSVKLDKALDTDRKAVGKALGYNLRPIEDFGGFDDNYSWRDLYKAMHGEIALTPIMGPNDIFARYLTEDCPYGLVPWSGIAKLVGVKTPIIDSCINIYTVIHETDWWSEGTTVEKLGLTGMKPDEIKEYVKTGR
jgi:opine dehydrogenase